MNNIRLSSKERLAVKEALSDFQGEVFLFGSRLDSRRKGGDIDILIKPSVPENKLRLKQRIQTKFLRQLEQSLDVVVFDNQSPFCQEIIKNAQRIDPTRL